MACPRRGTAMEGGVCPNCGFPVTVYRARPKKPLGVRLTYHRA